MTEQPSSILKRLQTDLLDPNVSIVDIMRLAIVLSYELHYDELNLWAQKELSGYKEDEPLPDYRQLQCGAMGTLFNGYWKVTQVLVPISMIPDKWLQERLSLLEVRDGLRKVADVANEPELKMATSAETMYLVNSAHLFESGHSYIELFLTVSHLDFAQVLDTVRNRLLIFVLELNQAWAGDTVPRQEDLHHMFTINVTNSQSGGNMSTFDQRNQRVNYQYNAAGNINIETVNSRQDILREVDSIREEIISARQAGVLDKDDAAKADLYLSDAAAEGRKENPNKATFKDYLDKAKSHLPTIASVAGIVNAVIKLIEIADKVL